MRLRLEGRAGEVTLQDGGRPGFRRFGVPPAGPWCRDEATLAAALAGHGLDRPVLEVAGALWGVVETGGQIAWPGGGIVAVDGVPLAPGLHWLPPGSAVRAAGDASCARLYLATSGGWAGVVRLGSASGPAPEVLEAAGHPVRRAPVLWRRGAPSPPRLRIVAWDPALPEGGSVRVVSGSRAGVRLGPVGPGPAASEASVPVVPGVAQHTPSGELIVLGPDGPTVGGYRSVGRLVWPDYERLGSLPAGTGLAWERVGPEEAARVEAEAEAQAAAQARDAWPTSPSRPQVDGGS